MPFDPVVELVASAGPDSIGNLFQDLELFASDLALLTSILDDIT